MPFKPIQYVATAQHRRRKASPYPDSVWQTHKDTVIQLHRGGATLKQILAVLEDKHDFEPTPRQLWTKMQSWGLCRTNNGICSKAVVHRSPSSVDKAGDGHTTFSRRAVQSSSEFVATYVYCWPAAERCKETHASYYQSLETCNTGDTSILRLLRDIRVLGEQPALPTCDILEAPGPLDSMLFQYSKHLHVIRQFLSIANELDIPTISWLYVIAYELAFTTALAAMHEEYREWFSITQSRTHLQAAARLLDLMKRMKNLDPMELSWFVEVHHTFHNRLYSSSLFESNGEASDAFWASCFRLLKRATTPSTFTTRSGTFSIVFDSGPEI